MHKNFAEIAIPLNLDKNYSYSVPKSLGEIEMGSIVLVPFGKKKVTGYVVGFSEKAEIDGIKPITQLLYPLPAFTEDVLAFYKRVSERYLAPLGEVIKMALPPGIGKKSELFLKKGNAGLLGIETAPVKRLLDHLEKGNLVSYKDSQRKFGVEKQDLKRLDSSCAIEIFNHVSAPKIEPKVETYLSIAPDFKIGLFKTRSQKEMEIAEILGSANAPVSLNELNSRVKGASVIAKRLAGKGVIDLTRIEVERTPYLESSVKRDEAPKLYDDQAKALESISQALERGLNKVFLLHGITGSGKTEVYLRAISKVLDGGKNALALVPEIALTPQFISRFRARFGEVISVIHSSMSKGERFDQWRKILRGESRIVIGARSALFAPLKNIGIVVVDEEHDHSYKQEDRIMYNAKDLAIERGRISNAPIVLGSATPSLESYYMASKGEYELLTLGARTVGHGLPHVEIVDLRKERGKFGKKSFLSDTLLNAIRENAGDGGKTILFLNRRGYSSVVLCTSCGVSIKCPDCSVSLKYHEKRNSLVCHYCDYSTNLYGFCTTCGSKSLARLGFGTEQVEAEIKSHFPDLVVERMDRDTTRKKHSHEIIIKRLEKGEIDILIGTQMVAKGLDARGVTLVGVILADVSMNLPDFRSCERTFSLLTQVAGRSGRGEKKGRVIVQTYNPEHYSIQDASRHDYLSFYEKEIVFRRDVEYPPFVRLVKIGLSSSDYKALELGAARVKKIALKELEKNDTLKGEIEILGPAPSPLEKLKGEFRWQILIKSKSLESQNSYVNILSQALKSSFKQAENFSWHADIDPQNFM
jgi:primosomal protein N' (replication factor Y) (superfamily II helicase)